MAHLGNTTSDAGSIAEVPVGNLRGLSKYFRYDLGSGFLVFLIALPLCLGIALACGYPAIAGIFTAVIGSLVAVCLSNSELTIKGPAAGLIVVVAGCVQEFGGNGALDGTFTAEDMAAYRIALAVSVAAACIQILFALCRSGALGEFFPTAAVHGMLAAIGVIIFLKQLPTVLGVTAKGDPIELGMKIPEIIMGLNPEIALIGGISLLILFCKPLVKTRWLKMIPAPLLVIAVAVPLGMYFDLTHEHTYTFGEEHYQVGEKFLVPVPNNMFAAIVTPDFAGLLDPRAWKWVIMFALIGSLESLLSSKAVDLMDPWKRKTNQNRDLLAVGVGNLATSMVGGLPMISEIVRSRANIDNGAHTRFANLFHGLFLLVFVATVPALIHRIPMAALAAMLVYTGFRLASPREFRHMLHIGREQFIIYTTTIIAVLATDLLVGIGIGIATKFLIHIINGVPIRSLFRPCLAVTNGDDACVVAVTHSAVFSSWILFKRQIERLGLKEKKNIVIDLSATRLVDHTVMEKLHELQLEFERAHLTLEVIGLEQHVPFSNHPRAARKKALRAVT